MPFYRAFGLTFASAIPLPGEPLEQADADVHIGLSRHEKYPDSNRALIVDAGEVYFHYPLIGSYAITKGDTITVIPFLDIPQSLVLSPLLGTVMAVLLCQRGSFVLHASSVVISDRAVAFVGISGAGKSTTAAAFLQRKHQFLTDDILPITLNNQGALQVQPGFPQVKLARQVAGYLNAETATSAELTLDAQLLVQQPTATPGSYPLRRIYILNDADRLSIHPLTPQQGFLSMIQHSYINSVSEAYQIDLLAVLGHKIHHFKNATQVANHIPMRMLNRPRQLASLERLAELVEIDLATD